MIITNIDQAVSILQQGGLVAIPTETVYGLAADAMNPHAVAKIFAAKERPHQHPLIVHLANAQTIATWARDIPDGAWQLAEHFWPGPLTLILAKAPHVIAGVTAQQDSIGLRVPAHPIAQSVLHAFAGGLAAPSANKFTHISPTTAQAVAAELGDKVDAILDGGPCSVGVESTIIDFSQGKPRLLRPGMLSIEEIRAVLGDDILMSHPIATTRAPGMHKVHYAPQTMTRLVASNDLAPALKKVGNKAIAIMAYKQLSLAKSPHIHVVTMPIQAKAYAQCLYQTLRQLDEGPCQEIWIEAVPDTADWLAIQDRLSKACARK